MRITESRIKQIIREEARKAMLQEMNGLGFISELEDAVGRRLELLDDVYDPDGEMLIPSGAVVNLYSVEPKEQPSFVKLGSTPSAEGDSDAVVIEVEVLHGGEGGPEGSLLGRGDVAMIRVTDGDVEVVGHRHDSM